MRELLKNKDVVLVLTGCIVPNCGDNLKINNCEERLKQYKKSIEWYYINTPYRIVFCENSGYNIANYYCDKRDRIEILTYKSSEEGYDRSKGYKEMEILEYAYDNSEFIRDGKIFIKITGRLVLLNICRIVNYLLKKDKSFICSYQNSTRPFSDCKFVFFTGEFWPILLSYKDKISNSNNFERITYSAINEAGTKGIKFIYPPVLDRVDGVGGGTGVRYNKTVSEYFFLNIKHQIRRFFFKIKILPHITNE